MAIKSVVMDPSLTLAIKGFVPTFGNAEDIKIVEDLAKLHKKLTTIDSAKMRETKKEKYTAKMKEIAREENYLTSRIIKRNLDF